MTRAVRTRLLRGVGIGSREAPDYPIMLDLKLKVPRKTYPLHRSLRTTCLEFLRRGSLSWAEAEGRGISSNRSTIQLPVRLQTFGTCALIQLMR